MPAVGYRLVDVELAQSWLAVKGVKRRLKPGKVRQYAALMRDGDWLPYHPDPIVLEPSGNVIQGQHRLRALIAAGLPQWMLVVSYVGVEMPEKLAQTLDRGAMRNSTDLLTIGAKLETPLPGHVAATARAMYFGLWFAVSHIPDQEFVRFYLRHRTVIEQVHTFFSIRRRGLCRAPTAAACARALYYHPPVDMQRFVEVLISGESLSEREVTVIHLRNWLLSLTKKTWGGHIDMEVYGRTSWSLYQYLHGHAMKRSLLAKDELFPLDDDYRAANQLARTASPYMGEEEADNAQD
jgi:hypothetical protein